MTPLTAMLLNSLALVIATLTCLWLVSLARRDASIVDPFWGTGFALVVWFALLSTPTTSFTQPNLRPWILAVLTTIWGARLSIYLLWRNLGHGEDRRYRAMREYHGPRFWWVSLLTVFWLQALILWIVSLPIQAAVIESPANTPSVGTSGLSLGWLDLIGTSVWLIGFLFESLGDFQMSRFQADPANAGKVMDRGLWRYTRHPNYFGDFCVWWGLYLIACAGGSAWTIFSPLLMSFLLLKVSGVTLLEKTIIDRRPEYAAYQTRTSPFFPWPPKNPAPTHNPSP